MPTLAKHITIRRNGILIDGQPVPWHIALQPITVDIPHPKVGVGVVYLPILIDPDGSVDADASRDLEPR